MAPLTLPGITNACYRLTVTNAAAQTVWQQAGVCADQYGDGIGAITYVGPCDADLVDDAPQVNTVTLELEDLFDSNGQVDRTQYVNPCGHLTNGNNDGFAPCELSFECLENKDVLVEFNITVMRDANQGFFDIAVNFDDIFCSAKVDCEYGPDDPIELLFDPATGERGQTAVLAFACTSGAGTTADTALHMNPITVVCDGAEIVLDPTLGPGNVWNESNQDPDPTDAIWQYATYFGTEDLGCGDEATCGKLYWNVAIGFDPTRDCSLSASATASTLSSMTAFYSPDNTTYPWVGFQVKLSGGGARVCTQNGLNDEGSGVQTSYTEVDVPKEFCHRFDGQVFASAESCGVSPECLECEATQDQAVAQLDAINDAFLAADQLAASAPVPLGGGLIPEETSFLAEICQANVDLNVADIQVKYEAETAEIDATLMELEVRNEQDKETQAQLQNSIKQQQAILQEAQEGRAMTLEAKAKAQAEWQATEEQYQRDTARRSNERDIIQQAEAIVATSLDTASAWLRDEVDNGLLIVGGGSQVCGTFTGDITRVTLGFDQLKLADLDARLATELANAQTQEEIDAANAKIAELDAYEAAVADYDATLLQLGSCDGGSGFAAPLQDVARMLSEIRTDLVMQQNNADQLYQVELAVYEESMVEYERQIQIYNMTIDEAELEIRNLEEQSASLERMIRQREQDIFQLRELRELLTNVYDQSRAAYVAAGAKCQEVFVLAERTRLLAYLYYDGAERGAVAMSDFCGELCAGAATQPVREWQDTFDPDARQ